MNLAAVFRHFGQDMKALRAYRMALHADPAYQPAREAYEALLGRLN
jgi:hypothetical protein